ncbi:MAG: IS481 family transposase, partial [Hydrogenophilales bacterium CG12_big_fil_rev_8_21_14_0_65_61_21]
ALNHQTPIQALKKWQTEKPELFVKRVYKQAELDN